LKEQYEALKSTLHGVAKALGDELTSALSDVQAMTMAGKVVDRIPEDVLPHAAATYREEGFCLIEQEIHGLTGLTDG
jgi:hypothetical protein